VSAGSAARPAESDTSPLRAAARWLERPPVAGVVLLLAYVVLSLFMSPRGYLGTDTGGKVATLETMTHHGGGLTPAVGYWAARWDPSGSLHGLYYTVAVGHHFVNVTTLPMVYAALPLYALGGYRLALLVPMAGAVAVAFAARALSRRLRPDAPDTAWAAYWIVGLATPVTIYALDLWEHTLGLAFLAWGVVVLFDAIQRRPTWWRGLLAGLAFGVAASLRTEAFVYGFVATAVVCVYLLVRSRLPRGALVLGAASGVGLALAFGADTLLEREALGSTIRASRAVGAAQGGGSGLGQRASEAVTMSASLLGSTAHGGAVVIVLFAALLVFVAYRAARRQDQRPAQLAATAVAFLYVARMVQGPGFVPGLLATTPLAAVGLVVAWKRPLAAVAALIALLSLPIVWMTDFVGGAVPQWGGRYILTSGLLLGVVGVAYLSDLTRWARRFFVVLAVGVTVFGLVGMAQRTHQVAQAGAWISARPEPVVVSGVQFWLRESGSYEPDHRWLTVGDRTQLDQAGRIVTDAGFDRFGLITDDDPGHPSPAVPGYHVVSQQVQRWLDANFRYSVYARDGT